MEGMGITRAVFACLLSSALPLQYYLPTHRGPGLSGQPVGLTVLLYLCLCWASIAIYCGRCTIIVIIS